MATLLVVEDHPALRDSLATLLEEQGYRVLRAPHGAAALQVLDRETVDVVVSDWHMPQSNVDGVALVETLRQRGDDTWFLLLSARNDVSDRVTGLEHGANDYMAKPFDPDELLARVALGVRAMQARQRQRERMRCLQGSLRDAADAQLHLLPQSHRIPGIRYGFRYHPCEIVSGDGLNVVMPDPDHVMFYLFDVSGHGVPAVMLATSIQNVLSSSLFVHALDGDDGWSPQHVVRTLNQEFPWTSTGRYITLFLGIIDLRSGRLRYTRAGHPPPYRLRPGGRVDKLAGDGLLLGLDADLTGGAGWQEVTITLAPGDSLLLYSDALMEARSEGGVYLSIDEVVQGVAARPVLEPDAILDQVECALQRHRGGELQDDLSLLALQYLGVGAATGEIHATVNPAASAKERGHCA